MPTIRLPIPMRIYANGQARVAVAGKTAGDLLDDLVSKHPELKTQLFDGGKDLKSSTYESMNIMLGYHDIRELKGRDTPVAADECLMIIRTWPAAISGGRQWNQPVGAPPPSEQ